MSGGRRRFGRRKRNTAEDPREPGADGSGRSGTDPDGTDPDGTGTGGAPDASGTSRAVPAAPAPPLPASGVSVGGANYAPIQNITSHRVSHVSQSAVTGDITAAGAEEVRALLDRFRAELALHRAQVPLADTLTAMASEIDAGLDGPAGRDEGALRSVAQALPALVAGTAVQEGGQALAAAIGGLLG